MAKKVAGKRVMSAEGLGRLILWHENKARFFKGMKGVDSVRKKNLERLNAAKELRDLRAAGQDNAAENIEAALFAKHVEDLVAKSSRRPRTIEVTGDYIEIRDPQAADGKSRLVGKPLVLMGITRGCLTDGKGFTQDLSERIAMMLQEGYFEGTPEQRTEKWLDALNLSYSPELVAHARKVVAGEVPLMADGPRGWKTMRPAVFGPQVRKAEKMRRAKVLPFRRAAA